MKQTTILFMGDFAPVADYNDITLKKGAAVFGNMLDEIKNADFSFINLECPLTHSTEVICKSGPNIKADIECSSALKCFDLVGMANNHVMDFGKKGLEDTINALKSEGVSYTGAGLGKHEADEIYYKEVDGKTIAVVALCEREFSQVTDYLEGASAIDAVENYYRLCEAKSKSDYLFVTLHCGHEYFPLPRPELRKLCKFYVDLGADAILCHHPHVPGAYEIYNGKPIVYSMGNTVFGRKGILPSEWREGYAVLLTLDDELSFEIIPYKLDHESNSLIRLEGEAKCQFVKKIDDYAAVLNDDLVFLDAWKAFVDTKSDEALISYFFPIQFKGMGRLIKLTGMLSRLCRSQIGYRKLNQIRCESHRELLVQAIKSKL